MWQTFSPKSEEGNESMERRNDEQLFERRLADEQRHAHLEQKIETLSKQVETLEKSVADLVAAWNTAGNMVSFVKWLSGAIIAITILIGAFKSGVKWG